MIESKDRQPLEAAKLFANVDLDSVRHLLQDCRHLHLARGEHLLEAGAENGYLYLVLGGELRVYLADRSLPEHAVFRVGDCVGEMSLLDGQTVSALVLAATDSELLAVPHEVLWSLVDSSHDVARNLLAIMSGRMRKSNQALVALQARSLEFEASSSVDMLTGIHNRRWLLDAFPRAIGRCERDAVPLCLVLADIDCFRRFNELFGHLAGDTLLRRVARQLAEGLRTQDLIARYGGEEFVILLPQSGLDQALLIAERLRSMVAAACTLETSQGTQGVTLSCGVAQIARGESFGDFMARADAALRRAKDNGRDRVETAQ
jgi:diguanylate cyclase (GGDEF)-like protein